MMIKSRRMRWMGHAACVGEMRNAYTILVGKPEGRDYLEELVVCRIILKWILKK
jgi:hypothetical protein